MSTQNACEESWADIETELTRRYDLVPNLVETARGYAAHEREALEEVIGARSAAAANDGSPSAKSVDELNLEGKLRRLFALAEGYPNLKANRSFQKLHDELTNCEDRIQRARRFYNSNVRDLADCLQMFPSNVIAKLFTFEEMEYFAPGNSAVELPIELGFRGD